jgi:hypothetical protein
MKRAEATKPAPAPDLDLESLTEPPHFGFGPPLSRLVKCRVEFREGMKIPGLGGGTRRYAPGLYDPDTMVAYVELAGLAGKVVLVSVHCGLITVDRTSGNAPLE